MRKKTNLPILIIGHSFQQEINNHRLDPLKRFDPAIKGPQTSILLAELKSSPKMINCKERKRRKSSTRTRSPTSTSLTGSMSLSDWKHFVYSSRALAWNIISMLTKLHRIF